MQFAGLLTESQVRRVHEASLELLEKVGVQVRNEKARDIFGKHGCRVDTRSHLVKIPRQVVEEYRQSFHPFPGLERPS